MPLIGAKDPEAFEVFYDRHGGAAYSLAYRIVGERAAAEDVTQEAFISIWRSGARFDRARGSVRSWMLEHRPQPRHRRAAQPAGKAPKLDLRRRCDPRAAARRGADRRRGAAARDRERAPRRARRAARRAVAGDRAGLLRRLQPLRDRRDAGHAAGNREGADAARLGEDSRTSWRRDWHDATAITSAGSDDLAAYLLGALEPAETADLERHLAACDRMPRRVALAGPAMRHAARVRRADRAAAGAARAAPRPRFAPMPGPAAGGAGSAASAARRLGAAASGGLAAMRWSSSRVGRLRDRRRRLGRSESSGTPVVSRRACPPGVTAEPGARGRQGCRLHLSNVSQLPERPVLAGLGAARRAGRAGAGVVRPRPRRQGLHEDRRPHRRRPR